MKYCKKLITFLIIIIVSSIYSQDNIVNEIAKGGKFIVRDEDQNEAMVIADGNVRINGTLKLYVLPKGDINNSIVVWDPIDNLLKLRDRDQCAAIVNDAKDEGWHTLGYDGLADDNNTTISASVQGTAVSWNRFTTDYGCIQLGPATATAAHIYTDVSKFVFNKPVFSMTGEFSAMGTTDLFFRTGVTPRMTIKSINGYMGIGTNNPGARLEVAGQVKITGGTPGFGKVLTSDATGLASWQTPIAVGGSTLWTESGSNIYRTDGNVGIGTSNPTTKLDVNGTASAKRYVVAGLYNITNGVWDQSLGNLAQITYSSGITPITINSDGSAGTYILVVKKTTSCTDCNISFLGGDVKFPSGVNPTLSSGPNTTDVFSFIAVGNNTFYCLYAKNLL